MTSGQKVVPAHRRRYGIDTGLFFVLLLLYVWLIIDPRLIHHSIGVCMPAMPFSYSTGWEFFREHLSRPGGVVEYAARWLTQFFAVGLVGALIITTVAWFMVAGVDVLTRIMGRPRGMFVRYIPAILLLMAWSGYSHPLRPVLSILVGLASFALYMRVARRSATRAIILLPGFCVAVYFVADAGGLLFSALVVAYEFVAKRRWQVALTALLFGLGTPWAVGMTLFHREIDEAYYGFMISLPGALKWSLPHVLALYLFFPAVLLLAASQVRLPVRWEGSGYLWRAICMSVVLLAAIAASWFSMDARTRIVLLVDYYAQREMWPDVLAAADGIPKGLYNVRCNRNVVLALCHTGRLGDDMFRYPQASGMDLFSMPEAERGPHVAFQESRIFLEFGQVNLAEKWACEALECNGDLPAILEQLAIINIVKGRPETARMFLTALSKKPLHRRKAREILQQLEEDPGLLNDPRVRRIRECMVRVDNVSSQSVEEMLLALVRRNPRDRTAFELLMAHYLHSCRPDQVVYWLQQPRSFEYRRLPRHFQEAIVILSIVAHGSLPQVDGQVDQKIIDRAVELDHILATYARENSSAREAALKAGFGDSFMFYFNFLASGM